MESDIAVSEELIQKYSNVVLGHVNGTVKELRRLFLVDDLVDSLKVGLLPLQPCGSGLPADPGPHGQERAAAAWALHEEMLRCSQPAGSSKPVCFRGVQLSVSQAELSRKRDVL